MHFPFKKHLSSLFSPLLKLFGMSNDTPEGFEFDGGEHLVKDYFRILRAEYKTPPESQKLRVVEASHYKQWNGSQHEYLVFTVVNGHGTRYQFRLERMPDEHVRVPKANQTTPTNSSLSLQGNRLTPSSSSSPSLLSPQHAHSNSLKARGPSLSSLDSVSKDKTAWDIVKFVEEPKRYPSDRTVTTVKFPTELTSPVLYWYQIVVLANTFHKSYPLYNLLSFNCYFLAGIIMRVLDSVYPSDIKVKKPTNTKDEELGNPKVSAGAWKTFGHTFNITEEDVKNLRRQYEEAVREFNQALVTKVEEERARVEEKECMKRQAEEAKEREREAREREREAREREREVREAMEREKELSNAREKEMQARIDRLEEALRSQGSSQA